MNVRLRPIEVGEAAAEQQQAAEGERVGGDDPLAVAVGEAEVGLGGGQRDVHDRRVEHDHQLGEGDDGERPPAAG